MPTTSLPAVISPEALEPLLDAPDVVVVDLSREEHRALASVPGARGLDYAALVRAEPPVGGLMPDTRALGEALAAAGIGPSSAVVACDDEGGGRSGRLLFTLDALGHRGAASMLDGGLQAWRAAGMREAPCAPPATPVAPYPAAYSGAAVADRAYILERLGDADLRLLDTRSTAEFEGTDRRAEHAGHIPGAASFDWVRAMDRERCRRLRPAGELLAELAALDVRPEHEVIVYCQTHHRSSHTYWVLRWLGFERVRGYPGAWSDWGNAADLPVEP